MQAVKELQQALAVKATIPQLKMKVATLARESSNVLDFFNSLYVDYDGVWDTDKLNLNTISAKSILKVVASSQWQTQVHGLLEPGEPSYYPTIDSLYDVLVEEFKVKDKAALNEELAKCTMYEDPTLELVNILINTLSEERAAILINTKLSILKHCDTLDITYELAKDPAVHSV